jgi:predicted nucleic acid-binding protein
LPEILERRGEPVSDVAAALEYLQHRVEPITAETYAAYERDAKERLRGRDEEDWPVIAMALALGCPVWTEDSDFFGSGIATWVTGRVEIFLKAAAKKPAGEEE